MPPDTATTADTLLSTAEAAEYCQLNYETFTSHADHYKLRPEKQWRKYGRFWTQPYLDKWLSVRGIEYGRPPKTSNLELIARKIATPYRPPEYEAQVLELLKAGVEAGKISFTEDNKHDAIPRARDYLLHEAGDWVPVAGAIIRGKSPAFKPKVKA